MLLAPLSGLHVSQPTPLDLLAGAQRPPTNIPALASTISPRCLHLIRGNSARRYYYVEDETVVPSHGWLDATSKASQPANSHSPVPQYPSLAPPTRIKPVRPSTTIHFTNHVTKVISLSSTLHSHKALSLLRLTKRLTTSLH